MGTKYGSVTDVLKSIDIFKPLIKKYSRLLLYCEAESDLIAALILILHKMPELNSQEVMLGYVSKSLNHE